MQSKRRTALGLLSSLVIGAIGINTPKALAQSNIRDVVVVRVLVQDEVGKPIPHATVWSFMTELPEHARRAAFPTSHLDADDLWRVTKRHGTLHEIISDFSDKPVPYLRVPPLGNEVGLFKEEVNYTEQTGRGNNYPRPNPLVFGYTFMKRGYLPGKVEFSVARSQSSADATVTLKRNPVEALETAPYIQAFERVRYALSQRLDRTIPPENQAHVQGLTDQLEAAAQQAIAAGDKKAAARMYARMRYMPKVLHRVEGSLEISGFLQGDAASPESQRAMDMAYQLDPQNLYVWMNTVDRQRDDPPGATQEQKIRGNLAQLEKIIAQYGEAAWPEIYRWRAGSCEALGDYAKARELYLQAAQFEPKYTDWVKMLEDMKNRMKLKKVPIPEGW